MEAATAATAATAGVTGSAAATAGEVPSASTRSATTGVASPERYDRSNHDPSPKTAAYAQDPSLSPWVTANSDPEATPPAPRAAAGSACATAGGAAVPGVPAVAAA